MQTIVIALFFIVLSGCGSFSAQDKETADIYLRIGTSQLEEGAFPQALASLKKAESLDNSNPVVHNNMALVYLMRERYQLAEEHLRKALSIKSDYSDARNNLGRVLIELGKSEEAIVELKIVIDDLTYPYPDKPLTNIGLAYFTMKKYAPAKENFIKALAVQKDNCTAQSYLGRSLFEMKQFNRAAEALDKAVSFCQRIQFDEPHYYSALSYYQMGDQDRSIARLEEVTRLYPNGKYTEKARSMLETIRR